MTFRSVTSQCEIEYRTRNQSFGFDRRNEALTHDFSVISGDMSGKFTIQGRLKCQLTVVYIFPDNSNPQSVFWAKISDTKTVGTKIISQTKCFSGTKSLLISNSGVKHVTYRTYGKFSGAEIRIRK